MSSFKVSCCTDHHPLVSDFFSVMQLYLGLRPAGSWPGPVHDLLTSASPLHPGLAWGRSTAPREQSGHSLLHLLPFLKRQAKRHYAGFKTEVCCSCFPYVLFHLLNVSLIVFWLYVFVRVTLQSSHSLLLCNCRFSIKWIMHSKIVLLRTNLIVWERCVHTPFVEQQGHVRGKVPMSPSLIGAYPSALSLPHYGRGRMLC